jgi:diketogulonate reductase-like aldo/keto reductase
MWRGTPFEDQAAVLAELPEQGTIRHIGLPNVTRDQFGIATQIVEINGVTAVYNAAIRADAPLIAAEATIAQILLSWHLQRSPVALSKDMDADYLELSAGEVATIAELVPQ